jgi:hypothetical protein
MKEDIKTITEKSEKVKAYLPVTVFIVLILLFEAFGLKKATGLVLAVFVSLFILGVMAAGLREKVGDLPELKSVQFYIGLLSFLFLIIIGVAFLHWYQIWHVNVRWILFFSILLIYFVVLFRVVHIIFDLRMSAFGEKKKKN